MILKGRLGLLFQMLPQGRCLLDVGTDHALIPAAAVQAGLFPRAVATDIRPGPLARAERTIHKHALEDRVTLLLGAGFAPVAPGLCDVLVLAGMGALMIAGILEAHPEVARQASCLLLQPMHAQERLRPWLRANRYEILDEQLAEEGDKRYQVLAVRYCPALRVPAARSDLEWEVLDRLGEGMLRRGGPVAHRWAADWTTRQARIADGLRRAGREGEALAAEALLAALKAAAAGMNP